MDVIESVQIQNAFLIAWSKAQKVPGRYLERQAQKLFEFALKIPKGTSIVEVGSYRGRSLTLLAQSKNPIISVDPLNPKQVKDAANAARSLERISKQYKNVEWFRVPRVKYLHKGSLIGLLHIDGDHRYPSPMDDFLHFEEHMAPNSFVVFHDFNERHQGVRRAIKELSRRKKFIKEYSGNSLFIGRIVK